MRSDSVETEARARFERLFAGHYGELLRFAQRRVGIDAAGDVVAETFLIAWRRLPEVPAGHARAWLYATARRVIANELRARQRRDRLSQHVAEPSRTRRRRLRRLTLAGALAAAVAVTAVAGVIPMPWSHGQMSSAAYAVTRNADGTVDVTVRWNQLHDPDALNARLRRAGVRAAVMLIVPALPRCVPSPEDSTLTRNGIEPR